MNTAVRYFAKRNINLFFKDKGTFFASLITPIILFVLYISFLKNVYVQSIESVIPKGITNIDDLINSFASSQLISSILAVSCVTVAFCSNIIMAQDKITGARNDLLVTIIARLLPCKRCYYYDSRLYRRRCGICLYSNHRLVFFVYRCGADSSGRGAYGAFRHGGSGACRLVYLNSRRYRSGFNHYQFTLRIFVRRLYADFTDG